MPSDKVRNARVWLLNSLRFVKHLKVAGQICHMAKDRKKDRIRQLATLSEPSSKKDYDLNRYWMKVPRQDG